MICKIRNVDVIVTLVVSPLEGESIEKCTISFLNFTRCWFTDCAVQLRKKIITFPSLAPEIWDEVLISIVGFILHDTLKDLYSIALIMIITENKFVLHVY